ncbi:MAG: hypothetical protein ACLRIS_07170 [Flavonifractor plautii]
MKEMQFTVERGGPLLPFLLEHGRGAATMSSRCSPGGRCRWMGRPSAATTTPRPRPAGERARPGAEARRPPSRCSMRTGASWSLTSPPAC